MNLSSYLNNSSYQDLGGKEIKKILKNSHKCLEESTIFLKNKNIIDYLDRYIKIMGVNKINMSEHLLKFFLSVKNLCGLKFLFILIRSKGKIIYFKKPKKNISKKSSISLFSKKKKNKKAKKTSKKSTFSLCNFFKFCKLDSGDKEIVPKPISPEKLEFKKIFSLKTHKMQKDVSKSIVRSLEETIRHNSSDDLELSFLKVKQRYSSGEENIDQFIFSDDEERVETLIPKTKFEINPNVSLTVSF
jgi:hypothetical protein